MAARRALSRTTCIFQQADRLFQGVGETTVRRLGRGDKAATAARLAVEPGAPLVVLKRTTHTSENQMIEVRLTKGRADRFRCKTEIR